MDTPHLSKPSRYLGRHRPQFLTRTVFAALVTATVVGTGLTAASAAPPRETTPAAAEKSAEATEEPTIEPEPTPSQEKSDSAKPKDESKQPNKPKAAKPEKKPEPSWVLPSHDEVSDVFGPRDWRGGEMHAGLDFAAEEGDDNYAAAKGKVVQAGYNGGYGLSVTIENGDGVETLYAHHSQLSVQVGDTVDAGDVIGQAGSTGDITGPHLHFEVHIDGEPTDPAAFLDRKGVDL